MGTSPITVRILGAAIAVSLGGVGAQWEPTSLAAIAAVAGHRRRALAGAPPSLTPTP